MFAVITACMITACMLMVARTMDDMITTRDVEMMLIMPTVSERLTVELYGPVSPGFVPSNYLLQVFQWGWWMLLDSLWASMLDEFVQ